MRVLYRYFNHTADIKFRAYGPNINILFKNALLAMFNTISDIKRIKQYIKYINMKDIGNEVSNNKEYSEDSGKNKKDKIKIKELYIKQTSDNYNELLWLILQDALSNADAEELFLYEVKSISIKKNNKKYEGKVYVLGIKKDTDNLIKFSKFDVKGVSMLGMQIKSSNNGMYVDVILDV
ncbi:MAG: archease [Candidatus Micrarchaeia archaeon]